MLPGPGGAPEPVEIRTVAEHEKQLWLESNRMKASSVTSVWQDAASEPGFWKTRCVLRYDRPHQPAPAKRLRQQGHSPSHPLRSAENAVGCGSVMIALTTSGARCAFAAGLAGLVIWRTSSGDMAAKPSYFLRQLDEDFNEQGSVCAICALVAFSAPLGDGADVRRSGRFGLILPSTSQNVISPPSCHWCRHSPSHNSTIQV